MNILSNLQQIANIIIRPSRYTYKITDLGNKCFKIEDKQIQREDFELKNPRGMKIKCSLYTSEKNYKQIQKCIIYLHCNSGCRVEGLAYLKQALDENYSYVVFDFTGSGLSEGKYVSLGFFETIDLECVFNHVKSIISETANIILWGRSMGAVTGLNFLLQKKPNIAFAIFDSPFKSLKDLFIQIGKQKTSFPEFILQMAYNYLKPIIQQKASFNIEQVDLKLESNSINCPCVFIASRKDSLVPFQQIDQIFSLYKGQKEILFIEQGHNQPRNTKVINQAFNSLKKHLLNQQLAQKLRQQKQKQKKNYHSHIGSSTNDKLEKKQLSKKKLQLTIKSLSHRQLLTGNVIIVKDGDVSQQKRVSGLGSFHHGSRQNHNVIKLRVRDEHNNPSLENKNPQQSINEPAQAIACQQSSNQLLEKKPLSCILHQKTSLKPVAIEQDELNRLSFQPQTQRKILHPNKSQSKLKVKRKPMQIKNFFGNENAINSSKDINRHQQDRYAAGMQGKTQRIQYQRVENKIKYQPLGDRKLDNNNSNILSSRQQYPKQMVVKTIPLIQPSKPLQQQQQHLHRSPNDQFQPLNATKKLKSTGLNDSVKINVQAFSLNSKQKQQPHSDIKTQSQTKNKINFHQDFVREKQFLKRSQSLQKVFKIQNISDKKVPHQPSTQTYREIKCTQRVLEKIIQKQQRKLLILNLQQSHNQRSDAKRCKNNSQLASDKQQPQQQKVIQSQRQQHEILHHQRKQNNQRKTMQHIVNKNKPFVELKGIKNYRSSLEGKYKTQIRK